MKIEHADPDKYDQDIQNALDAFEDALTERYKAELDDRKQVWTPHGEEPDPKPTASAGPGPDTVGIGYNNAKKKAPGWAAEVRAEVTGQATDCNTHDLNKIEAAFDAMHRAAKLLGENRAVGDSGEIPDLVNKINGRSGEANEFTQWAGISGEAFKNNFGQYVDPTMENQAKIATSLINLYSGHACIIESVRKNTLTAIERATAAILETHDSGAENVRWAIVNVAGIAVGFASAGAGAGIAVAAMAGQYLDSRNPDQEYSHSIQSVVAEFRDELREAQFDGLGDKNRWSNKITQLQRDIETAKSAELELYDFTGSDGQGSSPPAGGFGVDVEYVYRLSKLCFDASKEYERVITHVLATERADGDLKGVYDEETSGDTELKNTRDALVSFLQTTCARYYEAGTRLYDAARTYYGIETDNEDLLKALDEEPDLNGSNRDGKGGSVDDHVDETDRSDIEVPEEPPYDPYGPI